MNRDEKAASVAELHERFSKASVALVAPNRGLTVAAGRARCAAQLRAAGGEFKVAKNTLGKIAHAGDAATRECDEHARGPRGLVFGYSDPVAVAKVLVDYAEQNAKLQIDGGVVEGQLIARRRG